MSLLSALHFGDDGSCLPGKSVQLTVLIFMDSFLRKTCSSFQGFGWVSVADIHDKIMVTQKQG